MDLKKRRAHVSALAEKHALAVVLDRNMEALETLHLLIHERDVLDQQIAWENRRTGWAWPVEPAWTN